MADVNDVAAAVMESLGKPVIMPKLQNLLYYSQGWHLAWDADLLFKAKIEAWATGPVVREIHDQPRQQYPLSHPWPPEGQASRLTMDERETVNEIVRTYGQWSADQLALTTRATRPWLEARDTFTSTANRDTTIDTDVMQDYFTGLLELASA